MKKSFSSQLSLLHYATMMPKCSVLDEISIFSYADSKGRRYNYFILRTLMPGRNFLKVVAEGLDFNGFPSV